MLAYAYNNTETTSKSFPGMSPRIPEGVKVNLREKVKAAWPRTTGSKVSGMIVSLYLETERLCLGILNRF